MKLSKFIILEGPDNCGKTTLAKWLAKELNAVYWKLTCSPALSEHQAMADYQANALDNIKINLNMGRTVVVDRFWPSDRVYGPVFRDHPSLPERYEEECRNLNANYIYCTRNNMVAEHAKAKDPAHAYPDEAFAEVVRGYEILFDELSHTDPVFTYNLDTAISLGFCATKNSLQAPLLLWVP